MDHDLKVGLILYGLSMLPWLCAFFTYDRKAQWGLFLIDATLTLGAYLFLVRSLGWWLAMWFGIAIGVGLVLEAAGVKAYDNLTDRS
jgi:hypothetical protein